MTSSTDRNYDHLLFAGTHGTVLAIDKATGEIVWQTALPNSKYVLVSILFEDNMLFCGAKGRLFALDPENGNLLWTNELPGLRYGLIYLNTAQSSRPESLMAILAQHQAQAQAARSSSAGTT